jgi:hypothetical protein
MDFRKSSKYFTYPLIFLYILIKDILRQMKKKQSKL